MKDLVHLILAILCCIYIVYAVINMISAVKHKNKIKRDSILSLLLIIMAFISIAYNLLLSYFS